MPEATLTVRQLLGLPDGGLSPEALSVGLPDAELKSLLAALPGMPVSGLKAAISGKLSEALDIDPITVLAGAWEKYSLLSDAAKQSLSGETMLVPMAEHSVTSDLHPYVRIEVGPFNKQIDFDVQLCLKLSGVIVKIEAGEIRAIEAGTCEGSGEILVGDHSIWKQPIKPIPLPGKVTLAKGIPIH